MTSQERQKRVKLNGHVVHDRKMEDSVPMGLRTVYNCENKNRLREKWQRTREIARQGGEKGKQGERKREHETGSGGGGGGGGGAMTHRRG